MYVVHIFITVHDQVYRWLRCHDLCQFKVRVPRGKALQVAGEDQENVSSFRW